MHEKQHVCLTTGNVHSPVPVRSAVQPIALPAQFITVYYIELIYDMCSKPFVWKVIEVYLSQGTAALLPLRLEVI
jgi:hypothetical protein